MKKKGKKFWRIMKLTAFKSFLPLEGKMLTYLEAIKKPRKHIVKTLAMGNTAILIVPNRDSPPFSIRNLCMLCDRIPTATNIITEKTFLLPLPLQILFETQFKSNERKIMNPPKTEKKKSKRVLFGLCKR